MLEHSPECCLTHESLLQSYFQHLKRTDVRVQPSEEAPETQTAAEDTAWQEYRPEDFGIDAAGQAGGEEEEEQLRAAIRASKADVLAEEALFMSTDDGISRDVAADECSNGAALIPQPSASHRAWFPPADTFTGKASLGKTPIKGIGQQEASSGTHKEGFEDTYSDVMAFLLGS